jgi:hypothetical protein
VKKLLAGIAACSMVFAVGCSGAGTTSSKTVKTGPSGTKVEEKIEKKADDTKKDEPKKDETKKDEPKKDG